MRTALVAIALAAAGCNAVFGLDPPGSATDGGGSDDGGGDDDGGGLDAAPPDQTGRVAIMQYDYVGTAGGVLSYVLDANFGPPASQCVERMRIGECYSATCMPVEPNERPDAGRITFTGLIAPRLDPDATGHYASASGPGRVYNVGTTLRVTGAGAEVGGFDTSFAAPGSVVFSNPMPTPLGTSLAVPRAADWTFTWQPIAEGVLQLSVSSTTPGLGIGCAFAATGGTGKISRELLLDLPNGAGTVTSVVTTGHEVVVGAYTLQVRAGAVGKTMNGDNAAGPIVLQ